MSAELIVVAVLALLVGLLCGVFVGHSRRGGEVDQLKGEAATANSALSGLQAELAGAKAQIEADEQAANRFNAVAAEALRANNEQFLTLAGQQFGQLQQGANNDLATKEKAVKDLVDPVKERLEKLDKKLQTMDVERGKVSQSLETLARSTQGLYGETSKLSSALRDVRVRGNWGEIQLRQVVELAGMEAHCDFSEQVAVTGLDSSGRPDMVVKLPGARSIVVDSKVPLDAYLNAVEASDPAQREQLMKQHAKALADHVGALAGRNYPGLISGSMDLVVLFVPGEAILVEALDADPALYEKAMRSGIFLTSPANLVALLKSVAYGWREDQLAENAAEIAALGAELHERVGIVAEKLAVVGKRIDSAATAYNDVVGSFETRFMVTTRKLEELGARSSRELKAVPPVKPELRAVQSAEPAPALDAGLAAPGLPLDADLAADDNL